MGRTIQFKPLIFSDKRPAAFFASSIVSKPSITTRDHLPFPATSVVATRGLYPREIIFFDNSFALLMFLKEPACTKYPPPQLLGAGHHLLYLYRMEMRLGVTFFLPA